MKEIEQARAVLFDWFGTLAHPEPDRSEIHCQVAHELGVELPRERLMRGIYAAEDKVPEGIPPRWREGKDAAPFIHYQEVLLDEVGMKLPREVMLEIVKGVSQRARNITWAFYDDVLPVMKALKQRGLVLGLISNLRTGKAGVGLDNYLDFVVTSGEVGKDKPAPSIFLAALERARTRASETAYVGDQYQIDVLGARGVGISPILIDRFDVVPEVSDCLRIRRLTELIQFH